MRNIHILISLFIVLFNSCQSKEINSADFTFFEYTGKDILFDQEIDSKTQYQNPVLCGFYPDPSICKKNDLYYLVNSSFSYFPGIPIFKSNDLVNWEQIGHVLDRPSQLNLDNIRISGGIYAPSIEYNKFNNTFYLVSTCVDCIGNFLVKTQDPELGWSDPILLPEVGGIDPSIFFDDDGKAYILNNDAPEGNPEWDGHRAIWIRQFNTESDTTIGKAKVIVNGGVNKSQNPVWIEGPHLYKRNGIYILIAAEGGTGTNHSQVAFWSNNVLGPYIPFDINPILTQRNMPENRNNKISSVGHADLIDDAEGNTWAVFLGCRPYSGDYYNTGRETFLLPVSWVGNCPVILQKNEAVPFIVEKDNLQPIKNHLNRNFTWRDNFKSESLNNRWLMIRTPRDMWYDLSSGVLRLRSTGCSIYEKFQPAFLGQRQQHSDFEVVTELVFNPQSETDIAGLVCFQNEEYNLLFGKTSIKGKNVLVVDKTDKKTIRIIEKEISNDYEKNPIRLKISGKGKNYSFYAAFNDNNWQTIVENVDARNLSTYKGGGFVGTIIGPYVYTK